MIIFVCIVKEDDISLIYLFVNFNAGSRTKIEFFVINATQTMSARK